MRTQEECVFGQLLSPDCCADETVEVITQHALNDPACGSEACEIKHAVLDVR
jgi:hypothetical protein